jgi:pyridoxamine 5'-phosphate oxidase
MNRDHLHHLRKDYAQAVLLEAQAPASPFALFKTWFTQALAAQIPEPNAMTLATVGSDLRPSTRIVLIKECDERGPVWFTHYSSRKGQQLAGNPQAALQFHWVELERVVRIEGRVEQIAQVDSDRYFMTRPKSSQTGAWASPQSQILQGRADLDARVQAQTTHFAAADIVPRPDTWGGYRLVPDYWEFWQGRPSRLHDRLSYRLQAGQWQLARLAP